MIRIIICMMFTCIATSKLCAQDPQFSQFYATPLYTNPAKAGTDFLDEQQTARFGLQYRNQNDGTYKTLNLSYDQKFNKIHGGIGFNITRDLAGKSTVTVASNRYEFNYALHSMLSKKHNLHLNTSLSFGLISREIINFRFTFGDDIYPDTFPSSPGYPLKKNGTIAPLFNSGILLYGNNFYAGIAIHNLNQPNISLFENSISKLPYRFSFHAGYCFSPNRNFKITPQILYMKQQVFDVYVIGLQMSYKDFSLGGWYRDNSAILLNYESIINNIGYRYKNFKFMYSIDYPIKQTIFGPHYSHEVSLIYSLKSQKTATAKCSALY